MKSSRPRTAAVAVVILALGTVVWWQHQRDKRLRTETAALQQQTEQATVTLREENERLANQLRITKERSQSELNELVRLRGQAGRTRQIEQENAQLRGERDRLAKRVTTPDAQEPDAQQTAEQKLQRARSLFGRDLGLALIMAAQANDGNVPVELRGPIFDVVETLSAGAEHDVQAKQFELVYKGSLRDLKDGSATILAREKEPKQRSDGQWVRIYVMADGSSQSIGAAAPERFAAREQELWPSQSRP